MSRAVSTSTGVFEPALAQRRAGSRGRRGPGSAEVEQDDVERLGVDAEERAFAGALDDDVVLLALEPFAQRVGHLLFVFDDEHAHGRHMARILALGGPG